MPSYLKAIALEEQRTPAHRSLVQYSADKAVWKFPVLSFSKKVKAVVDCLYLYNIRSRYKVTVGCGESAIAQRPPYNEFLGLLLDKAVGHGCLVREL